VPSVGVSDVRLDAAIFASERCCVLSEIRRGSLTHVWWRGIELTALSQSDLRRGSVYLKSECNGSIDRYTVKSISKNYFLFVGWMCKLAGGGGYYNSS